MNRRNSQNPFNNPSFFWSQLKPRNSQSFFNTLPETCDVVIVGAGATGLAAAMGARSRGQTVAVIEGTSEIGGISKDNGGIVLDGIESDFFAIRAKYGEEFLKSILEISHHGLGTIEQLSRDLSGQQTNFRKTGFITAFNTEQQKIDYERRARLLCSLLPTLYKPSHFQEFRTKETGSPYYIEGGIYSKHGGTIDSAQLIWDLACKLATLRGVTIGLQKSVRTIEAAPQHGVRLYYTDRNKGLHSITAKRCILTGAAWGLIDADYPKEHFVTTGMIATSPLPQKFLCTIPTPILEGTPVQGSQIIGPDYYRFVREGKNIRLLFGSGARIGANEEKEIMKDILDRFLKVFPSLERYIASGDVTLTHQWARRQIYSSHDMPIVKGFDLNGNCVIAWPELSEGATSQDIPHIPVLYVGELGGHGITFSYDLGRHAGRFNVKDYRILQTLSRQSAPLAPLTARQLQRRAALERRELRSYDKKSSRPQKINAHRTKKTRQAPHSDPTP